MIKTLIISDSFKGSMSSREVGEIIQNNLDSTKYQADVMAISDGGEGFLDAIAYNKKFETTDSVDALGRPNKSRYLVADNGKTLCFELAESVGIKDLKTDELDVFNASTYGLGMTIRSGIEKYKPQSIILGIGGSASDDAGTGLLEALGVKFYDKNDSLIPRMCNKALPNVKKIDITEFAELTRGITVTVLTDVTNPLLGQNGATYVYAPQKGGTLETLPVLENNIKAFADVVTDFFSKDERNHPGAGAAGGVGYGMRAFWNASLLSGIDYVLEENGFASSVQNYDLVISGEGRVDSQSLQGKVLSGIIRHKPKKLCLVVGSSLLESSEYPVYAIVPEVATLEQSMAEPKKYLAKLIKEKFN